ncbi:PAS domain-containing protein [Pontibacter roseus]|uniref:PAS domain-containing protein n=1 Tax=Pontibacter roseus TaxID=336989 RepID=UPI00035CA9A9|nr:PAS domain-containing protein [Pontibacter roseus]
MDFNHIFENIPEAIVVISPEFKILGATNKYLETTMRQREDIMGKHFLLEAYPDKDVPYEENPVRISIDKAIQNKQEEWLDVIRYDLAKPEGGYEIRYWEASHTPVLDADGNVAYLVQVTKDVTEREQAREALQQSEMKFRFMADAMPQLIDADDAEGNSTYFNKRWESYTGIPVDKLLDGGWRQAIHPDDLPQASANWEQAHRAGEESQVELRIRDAAGDYRWHLSRYLPMYSENGSILMWIGSCSDIHDMKKMVQELLASNEQMSELADQVQLAYKKAEAERLTLERLIMQAPTFFAILKGPEHRYELLNDKYQALFPHLDLIGKSVAEVLPEIEEQGFVKVLDEVYSKGEAYEAEDIIVKIANAEGVLEDNYLTFVFQPLFDEHGKIHGILVVGYNVTDKFKMKQKLQELGIEMGAGN